MTAARDTKLQLKPVGQHRKRRPNRFPILDTSMLLHIERMLIERTLIRFKAV